MLVRFFKFWTDPDLLRQTPGGRGEWRGVRFLADDKSGACDCAIIHGKAKGFRWAKCPPDRVWLMLGEPPNEFFKAWHHAPPWIARIYSTDASLQSPQHRVCPTPLPWHVGRDYDFLKALPPPEKTRDLSWITSALRNVEGHRRRMAYLDRIRDFESLDLFGRGFTFIDDKWDGLAPYRYSLAFDSFCNSHYFTEKVTDCFLTWTMPIYHGCTDLARFFPAESFIRLDPDAPDPKKMLRDVIRSGARERNLDAIAEARRLVLDKYNLFEFIVSELENAPPPSPPRTVWIRDHGLTTPQLAWDLFQRGAKKPKLFWQRLRHRHA